MSRQLHPRVLRELQIASGRLKIEFGTEAQPGSFEYEISSQDRETLKAALRDANDQDAQLQALAREAILTALGAIPPVGPLLKLGGRLIMDLLGFGVLLTFDDVSVEASKRFWQDITGAQTGWLGGDGKKVEGILTSVRWTPRGDGTADARIEAVQKIGNWYGTYGVLPNSTIDKGYMSKNGSEPINIGIVSENGVGMGVGVSPGRGYPANTGHPQGWTYKYDSEPETYGKPPFTHVVGTHNEPIPNGDSSGCQRLEASTSGIAIPDVDVYLVMGLNDNPIHDTADAPFTELSIIEGPLPKDAPFNFAAPTPGLLGTEFGEGWDSDTADASLTPAETQNLITGPNGLTGSDWYRDYGPGANDPTAPEPITEPPGNDPPTTTPPPLDAPGGEPLPSPPPPGVEPLPAEPAPGGPPPGTIGPGGGNVKLPSPEAGGPDPWDPRYGVGNEICFVQNGKKRCYRIGYNDGKGNVEFDGAPYGNEEFQKPWCRPKGTPIRQMIRDLALNLGLEPEFVVVEECTKRWPGGCIKKGTDKLDTLWMLQDMCGYGIGEDENGNTQSGPITPLPIYHDYHENKNLVSLNPVSDITELYRKVVVFKRRRNGSILEVPAHVAGTSLLPEDRQLRRAVPRGTSAADMLDLAQNLAKRNALKTKMVEFEVPLNLRLTARHQVTFRLPSLGFTGRYMVWPDSIEHSYETIDSFWSTKGRAVELDRYRYTRRFEYVP